MSRPEIVINRHDPDALKKVFFDNELFAQIVKNELLIFLEDVHGQEYVEPRQASAIRQNLERTGTVGRSQKLEDLVPIEYFNEGDKQYVVMTIPPSDAGIKILKEKYFEYLEALANNEDFTARIIQVPLGFKNMNALRKLMTEVFAKMTELEASHQQKFVMFSAVETSKAGPLFGAFTAPFVALVQQVRPDFKLKVVKTREEAIAHVTSDK